MSEITHFGFLVRDAGDPQGLEDVVQYVFETPFRLRR